MFDIGFTEIIIICLVGLVVIGPKRLPDALRAGAMWMGRGKRMLGNVRRDLENEIGIDEIRRDLRNEQIMSEIKAENIEEDSERQLKEQQAEQASGVNSDTAQPEMQPLAENNESAEEEPRQSRLSKKKPHTNSYLDSATQNGAPASQNEAASSSESAAQTTASKPKE
ncbi:MAG: Sec-independent protein translocase protein TatB [Pseudomonadales bacterium]